MENYEYENKPLESEEQPQEIPVEPQEIPVEPQEVPVEPQAYVEQDYGYTAVENEPRYEEPTEMVPAQQTVLEKGLAVGKDLLKKAAAVPKKIWIAIGAAVCALVVLLIVLSAVSNTYKTPIKAMEKMENAKTIKDPYSMSAELLNGFLEDEFKELIKIMKQADEYEDTMEDLVDAYAENREEQEEEYGKNFKIKYKIEDKEKLEKSELKQFREILRNMADQIENIEEEIEDYDSDDWEDMADDLGISKSQAKKFAKVILEVGKTCKKAKVTDGYELEIVRVITGSELEEPLESERTLTVYKVDGRWVSGEIFSLLRMFTNFG